MNRVGRVAWLVLLSAAACAAPATERREAAPQLPEISRSPHDGEIVREIVIRGYDSPEVVLGCLQHTRVGEPLSQAGMAEDLQSLWRERRLIVMDVCTAKVLGGGVRVSFTVQDGSAIESGDSRGDRGQREVRGSRDCGFGEPLLAEQTGDRRVLYLSWLR